MQIFSNGENLHEISNPVFCEKNKKNIPTCCLLNKGVAMVNFFLHDASAQTAQTRLMQNILIEIDRFREKK